MQTCRPDELAPDEWLPSAEKDISAAPSLGLAAHESIVHAILGDETAAQDMSKSSVLGRPLSQLWGLWGPGGQNQLLQAFLLNNPSFVNPRNIEGLAIWP